MDEYVKPGLCYYVTGQALTRVNWPHNGERGTSDELRGECHGHARASLKASEKVKRNLIGALNIDRKSSKLRWVYTSQWFLEVLRKNWHIKATCKHSRSSTLNSRPPVMQEKQEIQRGGGHFEMAREHPSEQGCGRSNTGERLLGTHRSDCDSITGRAKESVIWDEPAQETHVIRGPCARKLEKDVLTSWSSESFVFLHLLLSSSHYAALFSPRSLSHKYWYKRTVKKHTDLAAHALVLQDMLQLVDDILFFSSRTLNSSFRLKIYGIRFPFWREPFTSRE